MYIKDKQVSVNRFFVKYIFLLAITSAVVAQENTKVSVSNLFTNSTLVADNIDELVLKGIKHIYATGERFNARAGSGQQAYDVNYILTNPNNRVHNIRKAPAIRYFSREMLAYFNGSLKVNDGLAQAAPMWKTLADKDGCIASNYGYYVFHQKLPDHEEMTQYDWVIYTLTQNLDSRKAFININQVHHKKNDSKDFPCTLGMQFFIKNNHLCCVVSSRSTDIYTGLPYDMGFFSFVAELVYRDLKQKLPAEKACDLKLGYVEMKTNFTQIYDKTRKSALSLLDKQSEIENYKTDMPEIDDAQKVLNDIYSNLQVTNVMKWLKEHAV